jgi:hypothetical protein
MIEPELCSLSLSLLFSYISYRKRNRKKNMARIYTDDSGLKREREKA